MGELRIIGNIKTEKTDRALDEKTVRLVRQLGDHLDNRFGSLPGAYEYMQSVFRSGRVGMVAFEEVLVSQDHFCSRAEARTLFRSINGGGRAGYLTKDIFCAAFTYPDHFSPRSDPCRYPDALLSDDYVVTRNGVIMRRLHLADLTKMESSWEQSSRGFWQKRSPYSERSISMLAQSPADTDMSTPDSTMHTPNQACVVFSGRLEEPEQALAFVLDLGSPDSYHNSHSASSNSMLNLSGSYIRAVSYDEGASIFETNRSTRVQHSWAENMPTAVQAKLVSVTSMQNIAGTTPVKAISTSVEEFPMLSVESICIPVKATTRGAIPVEELPMVPDEAISIPVEAPSIPVEATTIPVEELSAWIPVEDATSMPVVALMPVEKFSTIPSRKTHYRVVSMSVGEMGRQSREDELPSSSTCIPLCAFNDPESLDCSVQTTCITVLSFAWRNYRNILKALLLFAASRLFWRNLRLLMSSKKLQNVPWVRYSLVALLIFTHTLRN